MDDLFRLAVEACPAAMILVDGGGVVLLVNVECERMFGCSRAELVGGPIERLVPVSGRAAHGDLRDAFAARPSKRRMGEGRDLRAVRADGTEFPVEIGLTPIDGLGVLAFVVDISARLAAERSIREALTKLERANENLGRFAHCASHDLQEPLRKISVFADVLDEALASEDPAEVRYAADVMRTSAVRARRLVQDVLSLATADATAPVMRRVRLADLVDAALERLSQRVAEEGAKVFLDIGDAEADCDPEQVIRLVQNLVSNAIKYHHAGRPPTVRIRVVRDAAAVTHLRVEDDGIGVPAHLTGEIFAPFRRLHDHTTFPGSGIGLAICRTIAEHHGWAITCAANGEEGGRGTVFDVRMAAA